MEPRIDAVGVVLDGEEAVLADRAWYNYLHEESGLPGADKGWPQTLDETQSVTLAEAFLDSSHSHTKWANALHEHLADGKEFGVLGMLKPVKRQHMQKLKQDIHEIRMTAAVYGGLGDLVIKHLNTSLAEQAAYEPNEAAS